MTDHGANPRPTGQSAHLFWPVHGRKTLKKARVWQAGPQANHNRISRAVIPCGYSYTEGMRILFVCTANKLRSPTAEDVFSGWPGIEAISAGTDADAPRPLTKELVASADMIFAMENHLR